MFVILWVMGVRVFFLEFDRKMFLSFLFYFRVEFIVFMVGFSSYFLYFDFL